MGNGKKHISRVFCCLDKWLQCWDLKQYLVKTALYNEALLLIVALERSGLSARVSEPLNLCKGFCSAFVGGNLFSIALIPIPSVGFIEGQQYLQHPTMQSTLNDDKKSSQPHLGVADGIVPQRTLARAMGALFCRFYIAACHNRVNHLQRSTYTFKNYIMLSEIQYVFYIYSLKHGENWYSQFIFNLTDVLSFSVTATSSSRQFWKPADLHWLSMRCWRT